MKIASIIRARIRECSHDEFICAYNRDDALGIIDALYIDGWYEVEVCMITRRDKKLERKILDCRIGTKEEQFLLQKYYKKQG